MVELTYEQKRDMVKDTIGFAYAQMRDATDTAMVVAHNEFADLWGWERLPAHEPDKWQRAYVEYAWGGYCGTP